MKVGEPPTSAATGLARALFPADQTTRAEREVMVLSSAEELAKLLKEIVVPGETVVVGVGSELRCDDGFGVYLARSLGSLLARYSTRECLVVVEAGTALESYLDVLNSKRISILLDAVEAPLPPSDIAVLYRGEIPAYREVLTTHTIGIDALLNFIESDVYVVGTRPMRLDVGLGVSEPVARAIRKVLRAFLEVLDSHGCMEAPLSRVWRV